MPLFLCVFDTVYHFIAIGLCGRHIMSSGVTSVRHQAIRSLLKKNQSTHPGTIGTLDNNVSISSSLSSPANILQMHLALSEMDY